jgi:GGDEF domain-containing protein
MTIRPISEFNPDGETAPEEKSAAPNIRPIEEFVPEESTLSQMGTQLVGGVVSDIPRMTGQALQAFSPKDSTVAEWGKEMAAAAEERGKEYVPQLEGKNEFEKAVIQGARAIPASAATMAAYAVPGAGAYLGPAATVGLFGGSQYQDTYNKIKAAGGTDSEAHMAGLKTGVIQGGGELIANKLTLGMLGAGKKAVGEGVKGVLGKATDTSVIKPFLKNYAKAAVGEPATEIAQDVGTELVERQAGTPETPIGDIAYQSGTTALAMTTLLAPFGLGGHYANSKIAQHIDAALEDPTAPADYRLATVEHLHKEAKQAGAVDADTWYEKAVEDISKGLPVRRDTDEVPAATTQPEEPEQRQPEQRPQESAFASPIDEDHVKSFVDSYQAAIDKGREPKAVTAPLRTSAQVAGVYDANDTPDVMFQKLKGFVYPESPVDTATRELKEKLDAAPVKGVANRAAQAAVEAKQTPEQQEEQLPEYPSGMPEPDVGAELTKMSDKQLSIMFQQAGNQPEIRTAIKNERARRDASTIRSDTGLPAEAGQVGAGSEVDSSGNVYIPEQGPLAGSETTPLGDTRQEPQTLPQIEETNGESPNQAPQEAAPIEASPLEKARAELSGYSGGLDALTGPKNADARAQLMATITGDASWATKKVPLTRLQKEFAEPIHPAEVHAREETEKLKSELVAAGVKPEIVDTVAKNYQERRVKERAADSVTGFNMASDQKPTIERAIRSGQSAHYIEADVINLGGINAYFKDHAEPANAVLRGITDLFQEAAQSAGANAIMFRQGGDEVSAVILGGTNESVEAAIEQAKNKVTEFVKQSGLADIPHAKGKPIKGSGLHIGYSEITPDKNYSQVTKEASVALNASKTKKAPAIAEGPYDLARAQELQNSILEGELILRTGELHGRKFSAPELEAVKRSVDSTQAKLDALKPPQASRPDKQWDISSTAIPEEKRAGMRGLVNKNIRSISEQLAAFTNAGKAYVGPLQFTMNEDKSFSLKDNTEKSSDAATVNRAAASEFVRDFGGSNAQSLFADLDPANSKKVRDAAKAEISNMPNAERIQFVEDNFYDLLLELDESGKVKIKC